MTDTIESLKQQLAECQATNGKLREALEFIKCELGVLPRNNSEAPTKAFDRASKALAIPNDDTALNELIAERTKEAVSGHVEEIKFKNREIEELRQRKMARFNNEDCWIFAGDGEDHLESLVCPVVIHPSKLMELTAQRDALLAFAAAYIAAWHNGSPGDSDIFFMAESAIANCKEPGK